MAGGMVEFASLVTARITDGREWVGAVGGEVSKVARRVAVGGVVASQSFPCPTTHDQALFGVPLSRSAACTREIVSLFAPKKRARQDYGVVDGRERGESALRAVDVVATRKRAQPLPFNLSTTFFLRPW